MYFYPQVLANVCMVPVLLIRPPGKSSGVFFIFLQFFSFSSLIFFRGRKGAECLAISICCQLPLPAVRADEGILPINLQNVTTFGSWVTSQVVQYWHQKTSSLPIYAEADHEEPYLAFCFLENFAIVARPFMHPTYHLSLR